MEDNRWDKAMIAWENTLEISLLHGWKDLIETSQEKIKICEIENEKIPPIYRGTLLLRPEKIMTMEGYKWGCAVCKKNIYDEVINTQLNTEICPDCGIELIVK